MIAHGIRKSVVDGGAVSFSVSADDFNRNNFKRHVCGLGEQFRRRCSVAVVIAGPRIPRNEIETQNLAGCGSCKERLKSVIVVVNARINESNSRKRRRIGLQYRFGNRRPRDRDRSSAPRSNTLILVRSLVENVVVFPPSVEFKKHVDRLLNPARGFAEALRCFATCAPPDTA